MKVLDLPQTLPDRIDYLLQPVMTRPVGREALSEAESAAWRELLENQLALWAIAPEQLSDEGVEAPSKAVIQLAVNIAQVLRDQGVEAPNRVVPNGDGGIVFRWRSGDFIWNLELDAAGSLETSLVQRDHLLCRHSVHAEPSH